MPKHRTRNIPRNTYPVSLRVCLPVGLSVARSMLWFRRWWAYIRAKYAHTPVHTRPSVCTYVRIHGERAGEGRGRASRRHADLHAPPWRPPPLERGLHDVAGGRPGGLGGEHRSLSPARARRLPLPILLCPFQLLRVLSLSLFLCVAPFLSALSFLTRDHSLLYCPLRLPSSSSPTHRVLLFPLFSSRVLFFTVLLALSLFLPESCDRTQPNNHHWRLKPENSAASLLSFSHSTCRSFLSTSLQRLSLSSYSTPQN